jgi:activating signal cointegrator complex subunit 3
MPRPIVGSWKKRDYVSEVRLLIIDEIHLLGEDRGPVLEVIVSRMRYIAAQTSRPVRFMGLSTALANPKDLGDWLGVEREGLFNFRPSVRPIPMDVHVQVRRLTLKSDPQMAGYHLCGRPSIA